MPTDAALSVPIAVLATHGFVALAPAFVIIAALLFYFSAIAGPMFTARNLRLQIERLREDADVAGESGETAHHDRLVNALTDLAAKLRDLDPDAPVPPRLSAEWKALEAVARQQRTADPIGLDPQRVTPISNEIGEAERALDRVRRQPGLLLAIGSAGGRVPIIAAGATLLVVAVFAPGFPWVYLNFLGSAAGFLLLRRVAETHGRLTLLQVVPAVLVLTVTATIAAGFQPAPAGRPATYDFNAATTAEPGRYTEVGRTSDAVLLWSCKSQEVVGVLPTAISMARFDRSPAAVPTPSLWEVLLHGAAITHGVQVGC